MSGYFFDKTDQGPPSDGDEEILSPIINDVSTKWNLNYKIFEILLIVKGINDCVIKIFMNLFYDKAVHATVCRALMTSPVV